MAFRSVSHHWLHPCLPMRAIGTIHAGVWGIGVAASERRLHSREGDRGGPWKGIGARGTVFCRACLVDQGDSGPKALHPLIQMLFPDPVSTASVPLPQKKQKAKELQAKLKAQRDSQAEAERMRDHEREKKRIEFGKQAQVCDVLPAPLFHGEGGLIGALRLDCPRSSCFRLPIDPNGSTVTIHPTPRPPFAVPDLGASHWPRVGQCSEVPCKVSAASASLRPPHVLFHSAAARQSTAIIS